MIKFLFFKNKPITGGGLDFKVPSEGEFTWLFMIAPSEKEIERVCQDFKLKHRYFKTYYKALYSKKYENSPLQFVLVDYYLDNKRKVQHSRLLFTLGENFLITTIQDASPYYMRLFDEVLDDFKTGKTKTLGDLLHDFVSQDVEDNYEVIQVMEEQIRKIETEVLEHRIVNLKELIILKRELYKMNKRFWSASKIIFLLKKGFSPTELSAEVQNLLDDVYDSLHHQMNIIQDQRENLTDVLAIYETLTSNRLAHSSNDLNKVVKKLTAITLILMLPTLIATIYGMNFNNMPELRSEYGYYIVLSVMAAITIGSIWYARNKDWL